MQLFICNQCSLFYTIKNITLRDLCYKDHDTHKILPLCIRLRRILTEYTRGVENPYKFFWLKVPPYPFWGGDKAKDLMLYARQTLYHLSTMSTPESLFFFSWDWAYTL